MYDAYRPTTFYSVVALLIVLTVIIYVVLARDVISLILLVVPLWLYNYVQKKFKPLYDSRFKIKDGRLIIEFPRLPRIKKISMGRLSIVHQVSKAGEDIHVEFEERSSVVYKLEKPTTISMRSLGSKFYTGARIEPTYLTALFEEAYRLEYSDRIVYLGLIKPRELIVADNAGFDVSLNNSTLKVKVRGFEPPITVKSYSRCCGFHSKEVLVGKVNELKDELAIKLGVPEMTGIAIIPDKPYLPSLLGGMLSSVNYPISYMSNHPDSELVVEINDSTENNGEIIIKPKNNQDKN